MVKCILFCNGVEYPDKEIKWQARCSNTATSREKKMNLLFKENLLPLRCPIDHSKDLFDDVSKEGKHQFKVLREGTKGS